MKANLVRPVVGLSMMLIAGTSASAQARVGVGADEWWDSEHADSWTTPRAQVDARWDERAGYHDDRGRIDVRAEVWDRPGTTRRWNRGRVRVRVGPRHGRQARYAIPWIDTRWDGVRLRERRIGPRAGLRLDGRDIRRLIGGRTYKRLHRHAERIGAYGPLVGRIVLTRGPLIVQIRAGRVPVAELIDVNRDRRIDRVRLHRPWGFH